MLFLQKVSSVLLFGSQTVCVFMFCLCRTSPSRHVNDYAKGITALFPYLADPRSKFGYVGTLKTMSNSFNI